MQRDSTKLRDVEQLSLIPDRQIISRPVSLDHIRLLKSTKAALEYACQLADVVPKEVYPHMECDKSTWSRICSGEWDLDGRDIPKFNRVVGNNAYLLYLNHLDGVDLESIRKAQDDKDKRIAELEKQVADQERAIRLVVEAHRGKSR
jgi:hypothetical protein